MYLKNKKLGESRVESVTKDLHKCDKSSELIFMFSSGEQLLNVKSNKKQTYTYAIKLNN